jgi:hypothetical protein
MELPRTLLVVWTLGACSGRGGSETGGAPGAALELTLAERVWSEIIPGSRIALFATGGIPDARETRTHLADCADVLAIEAPNRVAVAVPMGFAQDVASIVDGADLRLAVCPSEATALARALQASDRVIPIPEGVPRALVEILRPGDHVDLYGTFAFRPEAVTLTLLTDLASVGQPVVGIAVPEDRIEVLVHAIDAGRITLGLRNTQSVEPTFAHLATMIPPGMVMVAVELPVADVPHPFVSGGDYVDLTVSAEGTAVTFYQAGFVMTAAYDGGRSTLGILATPDFAEQIAHSAAVLPVRISLRAPDDVAFVEAETAAPDPQPPLQPVGELPSDRIAHRMRGISVPIEGQLPNVGDGVSIVGIGADGSRSELLRQRVVAAIATTSEPAVALVQVTPREVREIALAGTRYSALVGIVGR